MFRGDLEGLEQLFAMIFVLMTAAMFFGIILSLPLALLYKLLGHD